MADLNHASIPTLVDAGQLSDGRPYFICDYVQGIPINDYCDENHLSTTVRLDLLQKVGEALQHAHNNLVLHLDIKPENVLVKNDGTPALLDFGVARLIGQSEDGQRAFSPAYASPEQIRGEKLSAASDVYSMGALMYRLLAGEPSFATSSQAPTETVLGQRAEFVERLVVQQRHITLNADLRAILHKAMADKPQARYATVDAFLRDLMHDRSNLPVSARTKTLRYRLSKFLGRYKMATVAVVLAFTVLTGFALRESTLRQRAQEASATTKQVSDYLVGIFKVMDPGDASGSTVTARELLDTAVNQVRSELGDRPAVAARIMRTMGDIYAGLGLYEQATIVMEDARRLGGQAASTDDEKADLALLLGALGEHYITVGRYDDAEEALVQSIALTEKVLGSNHEYLPLALSSLGKLQTVNQQYSQAKILHTRALAIAEQAFEKNDPRHASLLVNLGVYYSHTGSAAEQEALLKRVVEIQRSAHGAEHINVADALSELALYYVAVSRPHDAIDMLERAHELALRILGPDHPVIGAYLFRLGVTHMNLANYTVAEDFFLEALDIQERAHGAFHNTVGSTYSYLGSLYNLMNQTERALEYLTRSLEIMRKVYPEDHASVGYQKLALGEVLRVRGSLIEAERFTRESIETFRAIENSTLIDPTSEWQLANILRDQDRHDEALTIYARLYAWHHENPSPDDEYMLEIATQFREFLQLIGRDEQAANIVPPVQKK